MRGHRPAAAVVHRLLVSSAESWPAQRWVVVKCEANAQGTNRRAVVTNRPGAFVLPGRRLRRLRRPRRKREPQQGTQVGLQADRLSDHRYFANLFRLYLHTAAYNLLVRMRQRGGRSARGTSAARTSHRSPGRPTAVVLAQPPSRTRSVGRRPALHVADAADQGGRARACKPTRRVVVELSASWPYLGHYRRVGQQVLAVCQAPPDTS